MACPYAFIFGIPGKGFHSYRFMGLAVGDTIGTILLALATAYLTNTGFWWNLLYWWIGGEVLHYLFGTPTAFLKMIGMTPSC
jgi:hypothetical protein